MSEIKRSRKEEDKMNQNIVIRMANELDAEALLAIYTPYVLHTAITFEYVVPTLEDFKKRIQKTLRKFPYLVAVREKEIVGYAYVSPFKERAAYDWAVETSIYIKEECRESGIGTKLYLALEEILKRQNIINLNACIAYPNPGSIRFHEQLGYQTVAHFTKCGYKLDTWHDMIWMEKMIGEHTIPPQPIIPVTELELDEVL